jgi:hypothetical protein
MSCSLKRVKIGVFLPVFLVFLCPKAWKKAGRKSMRKKEKEGEMQEFREQLIFLKNRILTKSRRKRERMREQPICLHKLENGRKAGVTRVCEKGENTFSFSNYIYSI